ncbi:hypothetical protein Tco_0893257 [Tanacetum coccineum]|uniref:RNA-directed DNA polymerase, eukaryota, reverse transcriptase zinc-binding domain protein n=1 Tax=Tanacetum coccineum TaxID=301880 RepID=A0ABQ5C8A4_9ASTR
MPIDKESPPAIVLEDDCLNAKDLTLSLMGRVKEMASLVNLKKALCNEGFDVVKISYLRTFGITSNSRMRRLKTSFRGNVGVGSWFLVIKQAYAEFVPEGRLVWVELDGVLFKFWSGPTFKRIAAKWGELLDVDDYDESNLHSKRICILSKINDLEANNGIDESDVEEVLETLFDQPDDQKDKHSEDPFGLYPLLNKENIELARKVTDEDHSLSHPPGFTPEEGLNEGNTVNLDMKDYGENERDDNSFVNLVDGKDNSESVNKNSESKRSGQSKYSVLPRTGGSILNLMEEVMKLEVDGFDKLVRDSWNVAPVNKKNAIRNFMGKLKFLKDRIRSRLSIYRSNSRGEIYFFKKELRSCDEVNNIQASEIAQKAKIKWAIDGDENVKFFHGMLNKKRNQSNIRGIMVNGMWVDDPVLVTRYFYKRVKGLCGIAALISLRIMGVNVEDGMVKNAASKLGCLVLKTPFTYLGTKVGGNMSRKQAWKEVVDKVLSRLSRWKMKLLSIGGRLTLLKFVLGSISIFHMSIFKVPSSILKSLESIRSQFFNGQDPKSNKASWVKWNKAIYGEDRNLNKDVSGGVRTCWTLIVHEVRVLQGRGINVADYIRLKLGNGENTQFWVDNWYEGGVIKELFPRMFALELNKNDTVSSKLNASSLDNSFRRKARSGIEEMQLNSLAEISRMTTIVPCEDSYVWTLESDGICGTFATSFCLIRRSLKRR